jgi:hypothetical protein
MARISSSGTLATVWYINAVEDLLRSRNQINSHIRLNYIQKRHVLMVCALFNPRTTDKIPVLHDASSGIIIIIIIINGSSSGDQVAVDNGSKVSEVSMFLPFPLIVILLSHPSITFDSSLHRNGS